MLNYNIIQEFEDRGLIAQSTCKKSLNNKFSKESVNVYCGFDPTADSLHLGHLPLLLSLKRFQENGHKPFILLGGATALIGDPSFKIKERQLNTLETVQVWTEKISQQISLFFNINSYQNDIKIINNYTWFKDINLLDFLRIIGKYFSINQMINKESVKQRIDRDDLGISFTEFSYNLLQSYDFVELFIKYNVQVQIGGSDQWGNIVSGVELVRRLYKKKVFGLTIPLITKRDGKKFGKTETNIIWLDSSKTSQYKFYQFWINISDEKVYDFLKIFTFMSIKDINEIKNDARSSNKQFKVQYILAEQVTKLVHGDQGLRSAKRISEYLFSNSIDKLKQDDLKQLIIDGMPVIELNLGMNIQEAVINAQFASSFSQAKKIINSNGISINNNKCKDPNYIFNHNDRLFNRYSFIKKGKKNFCLIIWKI